MVWCENLRIFRKNKYFYGRFLVLQKCLYNFYVTHTFYNNCYWDISSYLIFNLFFSITLVWFGSWTDRIGIPANICSLWYFKSTMGMGSRQSWQPLVNDGSWTIFEHYRLVNTWSESFSALYSKVNQHKFESICMFCNIVSQIVREHFESKLEVLIQFYTKIPQF